CGPPVQMLVSGKAQHKGISEEEVLHDLVGDFPLGRMTEDGEVADVVMLFASDLAKAVTGQHLMVNAGELMRWGWRPPVSSCGAPASSAGWSSPRSSATRRSSWWE